MSSTCARPFSQPKKPFPYIKRRLRVIEAEKVKNQCIINHFRYLYLAVSLCSQIELEPLEVAIINMTNKIGDLRNVLSKEPCDPKLLQMQLQGENSYLSQPG